MLRIIITLLILVLSLNVYSDSKRSIVKWAFGPVITGNLDTFKTILSNTPADSYSKGVYSTLPEALRLENLINYDDISERTYDRIAAGLTEEEAANIETYLSTEKGRIMRKATIIVFKEGRDVNDVMRELLHGKDFKAMEQEVASKLSEAELTKVNKTFSSVEKEVKKEILSYLVEKTGNYYKNRKFTKADSELCNGLFIDKTDFYAIPICDAGVAAGDYQSSLRIAEYYWSGSSRVLGRDVKKAKEIYRSVLQQDKSGAAHYYLGMLVRNVPDEQETELDSYCLIMRASELGFPKAANVLNEFDPAFNNEACN